MRPDRQMKSNLLQDRFPEVVATVLLTALLILLLLTHTGCGGTSRSTGDHAGTANQVLTVSPANVTVAPGQTVQFSASSPWGGSSTWSVLPAAGGSCTANGLFTAANTPGQYTIVAMWNGDVRYTATARTTVLPPPPPALSTPNLVSASGVQQGSANGKIQNAAVVGEPVPAIRGADAAATVEVRHGFKPDPQ